ncbi:MAG: sporulation protein YqfD [Firmicutes bacterium]|nr:sporulation protein YqfD [Bacillota bacterium]
MIIISDDTIHYSLEKMKFNTIKLRIEGFNQLKLLSHFQKEEVRVFEVEKISPRVLILVIQKKDGKKVLAILEKMCYTHSVISSKDAKSVLRNSLGRLGLIITALICTIALSMSYGFIWRIDIDGNEKLDELIIQRMLDEHGVRVGTRNRNVDADSLINSFNALDEVLMSSVEVRGTTLVVRLVETIDYIPPHIPTFNDIHSRFDAEITRMVVYEGTPMVILGERVFKGDILIGAHVMDFYGLEKIPTPASARIYGRVAFSETVIFNETAFELQRTGRRHVSDEYRILGFSFGASSHDFARYEYHRQEMTLFENFFVPLRSLRTVYYEVELIEHTRDVNAHAEQLKSEFIQNMTIKAGSSPISTSHVLTKVADGVYRLSVFVEAELLIS